MTTNPNDELTSHGYAVVWFGNDGQSPQICKGMGHGKRIDGVYYAIFDTADEAATEFKVWPHVDFNYGILPVRQLIDEQPRYSLKESAR